MVLFCCIKFNSLNNFYRSICQNCRALGRNMFSLTIWLSEGIFWIIQEYLRDLIQAIGYSNPLFRVFHALILLKNFFNNYILNPRPPFTGLLQLQKFLPNNNTNIFFNYGLFVLRSNLYMRRRLYSARCLAVEFCSFLALLSINTVFVSGIIEDYSSHEFQENRNEFTGDPRE